MVPWKHTGILNGIYPLKKMPLYSDSNSRLRSYQINNEEVAL